MGRGFNRLIPRLTRLKFTLTGPRTDNTSTVLASVKDRGFPDSAPSQDLGSLSGLGSDGCLALDEMLEIWSSLLTSGSLQDSLNIWPDRFKNDSVSCFGWVDPVGQIEFRYPAHTIQKKGYQRDVFLGCHGWIELAKLFGVLLTHIWRDLHACQDDLSIRIFGSDLVDDSE